METAAPLPHLVLWRTDHCHLCEETAELLAALMSERAAAGLRVPAIVVRRIAEDPAVEHELHDHVPVLEISGRRLLLATRLGPVRAFLDEAYG